MTTDDNQVNFTNKTLTVFLYLLTFHTALLVASNAAGTKMIALPGGLAASATVFSYMVTFVVLDIVSELYGKKYSKLVINVGLGALILSVAFFQFSIIAPAADFWSHQDAYEATLGSTLRILIGGWTAYMVSQYLDVWLFFRVKSTKTGRNKLWLRALVSTAIGQFIDTCIFITIAFYGVFPILPAIAGQYILKLILAIISLPIVYIGVKWGHSAARRDE